MSFRTHTKGKKEFILFLTKLTSILFLPFYSNIIKAVKAHERDGEMRVIVSEEEKQFVTVYHSEKKEGKMCVLCVALAKKEEEETKTIEETRLLILHEMNSKLYNV